MTETDAVRPMKGPRTKISQTDIPRVTLDQALRVPRAIADQYGKTPTRPLDVAAALNMTPTAGSFRELCGASIGYGLTEGGPNAQVISLTPLGRRAVAPLTEGDDARAQREAALQPTIVRGFLEQYDGSALPSEKIAFNVLESKGVPASRTQEVHQLILRNAESVGFLKPIKDRTYVDLTGAAPATPTEVQMGEVADPEPDESGEGATPNNGAVSEKPGDETSQVGNRAEPNAIFLGHGKNRKPLDQLIRILDEYGIPHKEAIAEPNAGRPIPAKVAGTMRECGAAILIFTADEEFRNAADETVWRPSENVAHELGAASVLYDNRIIIFKEEGVTLASNFSSIGYISFEKDKLSDKGIDLFRELVNFKIVSVRVGG
jgi:Predicted nucleotide-binding protein containing TIR-like domain